MGKLFALILLATSPLLADDLSYHTLQSGPGGTTTPITDHGLHGEGQIVAVLDTGVDWDTCFFAEPDGSRPPINTTFDTNSIDLTRRKIVAYDFLYSCDLNPGAAGCDDPNNPAEVYDNQGHGTHAAASAVGSRGTASVHEYGDALATGAKLIVQGAGYIGGDNCSQRPGIGCPVNLTPILQQAYRQGARIHSNSWGDRQGIPVPLNPPVANYPQSAYDVDSFIWSHPDMLVVFNTGNNGTLGVPHPSSVSAPGCAKNTLQIGGTRMPSIYDDNVLSSFDLFGPTQDGRIKPDLVGPAEVLAGDAKLAFGGATCGMSFQPGTSWSSPSIAGAAALVRQYYTEGFYPSGAANPADAFTPSAALLKATLVAAGRRAEFYESASGEVPTKPVPSYEQGFGFPVLGGVLYFPGNTAKLRAFDVPNASGLAEGQTATVRFTVHSGTPLKAALVWTDPPGPSLMNNLVLSVVDPSGATTFGNDVLHPGRPDRVNNVQGVAITQPLDGTYTISVSADHLGLGPKQGYALVATGDLSDDAGKARARAVRH